MARRSTAFRGTVDDKRHALSIVSPTCSSTASPPPNRTEDELDLWEPKLRLDMPRVRDWWKANGARFDPARRYQTGLHVTDTPLAPVFDQLPLAFRYDVSLRECALTPGTPDGELATWTWKQRNPDCWRFRQKNSMNLESTHQL